MMQSQRESQKKSEGLIDSEARFRATFENAAVGIARVAPDGHWLEVNQRLCDIIGYTREELMAKTFGDITHPDDLGPDWGHAQRVLAGEIENYSMEKRYYRKDGSVVWVNLTVSVARKADGSPDYFVAVVEDISARKRMEEANLKRVALLADVNAALAEHKMSLRSMLQKSAEALVRDLDLAFARIWTLNPKESMLELQASAGLYTHLNGGHSRVPVGEFKIGLIAKERQPHLTNDVAHDPRISDPEWAREMGMVAFAGYPLLVEDRVVGVMGMFARHRLPDDTIEAIATVAAPIAQGIERKRAEEALCESMSRFRQMAESLPQLVWTSLPDGQCDYLSPQWVAYTGIPEAEQLGFDWLRQLHPDDRQPVSMAWNHAVSNGVSFDAKCRIRRHDGVYRWFKMRAVALRDSGGKIIKWFGSNMDIDDQKQAEEALRESKERLAGIVSSAMDAIITVDDDQRIILFNEAAERMFGCLASEALGQPLNRFIPDRFRAAHTEDVRRFGEPGASRTMGCHMTLAALRSDGAEFPIEAAISSIEVGGRKLYTVIYRDITERKRADAVREELLACEQAARAACEAANRSKDEFLAMVSHELRTPLNAILGYSGMLRSGVERNVKAQLQIIDDLLDSARIITGRLRIEHSSVDLAPTLKAALDTARPAAEAKGITLVADFDPLVERTLCDPGRLQQVVWNLLSNAVKFTPEGGRVELRMEGADDNVRITVSDTGQGIEPERLPFVFDRFWQADSSSTRHHGGLGLGLSLVKHLVELHGGTITAASEGAGRGATFTVTLPHRKLECIEPPAPAAPPREVRTEGAITMDHDLSLEGVSVLVVDDLEGTRESLIHALSEYGAQVAAASSGVEALAFLSNPPGGKRPDVLILDIAMPDEDGYTVLKKVRALEAVQGAAAGRIPAIALTAHGQSEDRLRALQAGFHTHVAKPVDPAELAAVITSLTTGRAWERKRKE